MREKVSRITAVIVCLATTVVVANMWFDPTRSMFWTTVSTIAVVICWAGTAWELRR